MLILGISPLDYEMNLQFISFTKTWSLV